MKKEKHSTNIDLVHHSMNPNKVILILAWPAILEQLLQTFVSYVDTAMVGNIGVDATAAVAVNMPLTWMIYGILNGIGLGRSVIVAKKIGEQDLDGAKGSGKAICYFDGSIRNSGFRYCGRLAGKTSGCVAGS